MVAVSTRGGLLESELASLLEDLETGGAEGTGLFPSTQVLIHLQLQPLPSVLERKSMELRVLEGLGWG